MTLTESEKIRLSIRRGALFPLSFFGSSLSLSEGYGDGLHTGPRNGDGDLNGTSGGGWYIGADGLGRGSGNSYGNGCGGMAMEP